MKIKISAGTEIDVLTQREMDQNIDRLERAIRGLKQPQRLFRWVEAPVAPTSNAMPAAGLLALKFEEIPANCEWRVRMVTVTGVNPATGLGTGLTGVLYRDEVGPLRVVDAGSNGAGGFLIPNTATYSPGECVVWAPTQLVIGITDVVPGTNTGTKFFATALVEQAPNGATLYDSEDWRDELDTILEDQGHHR